MFDYKKICLNILKGLKERQKNVLIRRFGLTNNVSGRAGRRETLESIGKDFGVTRERVRQIEKDGVSKIKPKVKEYQKVFDYFKAELKKTGGIRREDILLSELGGSNFQRHVFFLFNVSDEFCRIRESPEFYASWALGKDIFEDAKTYIKLFADKLNEAKHPLRLSEFAKGKDSNYKFLEYFLELSKLIQKNSEGFYGFKYWPEINPRNIRDKAFLVLKKVGKPIHFREVTNLIGPDVLPQSVHNELIRDDRFVLVGRGIYALKEWGFREGDVKDIILDILRQEKMPLTREEIVEKVLAQRMVKKNTVLLNLTDKRHFLKTPEGKYTINEA